MPCQNQIYGFNIQSEYFILILSESSHLLGRPGWGIAWYINGVLIPELVLQRGRTYTFIVEGGSDSTDPGNYHPFYITDSIEGGKLTSTNRAVSPYFYYPLMLVSISYCQGHTNPQSEVWACNFYNAII